MHLTQLRARLLKKHETSCASSNVSLRESQIMSIPRPGTASKAVAQSNGKIKAVGPISKFGVEKIPRVTSFPKENKAPSGQYYPVVKGSRGSDGLAHLFKPSRTSNIMSKIRPAAKGCSTVNNTMEGKELFDSVTSILPTIDGNTSVGMSYDLTPIMEYQGMGFLKKEDPLKRFINYRSNVKRGSKSLPNPLPKASITARETHESVEPINPNSIDSYVMGKAIGVGAYATVRLAQLKNATGPNDKQFAIKTYEKYKLVDPVKLKNVQREVQLLTMLDHPNVIKLHHSCENAKQINLIMEYTSSISLLAYLRSKPGRRVSETEARSIFKQILNGIHYCHSKNIIHRDIKLDNILIDPQTGTIKIIDFGFAIALADDRRLNIYCGTPCYMAPEILSKHAYRPKPTDVWGLGVVLYYILCGTFPFKGLDDKDLQKTILRRKFEFPAGLTESSRDFISSLLTLSPDERPTTVQALAHGWLAGSRKNTIESTLLY